MWPPVVDEKFILLMWMILIVEFLTKNSKKNADDCHDDPTNGNDTGDNLCMLVLTKKDNHARYG